MDKLTEILNSIPKKLMEMFKKAKTPRVSTAAETKATEHTQVYNSETATDSSVKPEAKLPPVKLPPQLTNKANIKKFAIAFGAILLLLVVVNVVSRFIPRGLPNILGPSPTPSATPAVVVVTPPPSKYATDEGILKIEADIKALETEMSQVELDETNLRPRPLDYNVNFK